MAKITKKQKKILEQYNLKKKYTLIEATKLVKETHHAKFDATVDIAVNLGIQPTKADQMVRGVTFLPHGVGKTPKILVICTPDKEKEARDAGADYVGLDEYIKKIEKGWTQIDVIVTLPSLMGKIGKLGKILGPRGLMPNPKTGTVTLEVGKTVAEIKSGKKINFKVDKYGIIHARIAKVSFEQEKIQQNAKELIDKLIQLKPPKAKGTYIKHISLSSTMGPGITVNTSIAN